MPFLEISHKSDNKNLFITWTSLNHIFSFRIWYLLTPFPSLSIDLSSIFNFINWICFFSFYISLLLTHFHSYFISLISNIILIISLNCLTLKTLECEYISHYFKRYFVQTKRSSPLPLFYILLPFHNGFCRPKDPNPVLLSLIFLQNHKKQREWVWDTYCIKFRVENNKILYLKSNIVP